MTCRVAFNQTSTLRLHRVNLVPVSQLGNQRGTRKKGKEGVKKRGRERKREILARERKNKKKRKDTFNSTCTCLFFYVSRDPLKIPRRLVCYSSGYPMAHSNVQRVYISRRAIVNKITASIYPNSIV